MDRGAWRVTVHGVARVGHDLVTKERERERHLGWIIFRGGCSVRWRMLSNLSAPTHQMTVRPQ